MRYYRFMDEAEFTAMCSGETLHDSTIHSRANNTDSEGFCFFSERSWQLMENDEFSVSVANDVLPDYIMKDRVLVEFEEKNPELMSHGQGVYSAPYSFGASTMIVHECSTTEYSTRDLAPVRMLSGIEGSNYQGEWQPVDYWVIDKDYDDVGVFHRNSEASPESFEEVGKTTSWTEDNGHKVEFSSERDVTGALQYNRVDTWNEEEDGVVTDYTLTTEYREYKSNIADTPDGMVTITDQIERAVTTYEDGSMITKTTEWQSAIKISERVEDSVTKRPIEERKYNSETGKIENVKIYNENGHIETDTKYYDNGNFETIRLYGDVNAEYHYRENGTLDTVRYLHDTGEDDDRFETIKTEKYTGEGLLVSREVHSEYISALDHKTHYEDNPGSIEYYDKNNRLEKIETIDYGNIKEDYAIISTAYFDSDGSVIRSETTEETLYDRLGNDYPPPKVDTRNEDAILFSYEMDPGKDYDEREVSLEDTTFIYFYFGEDGNLLREEHYDYTGDYRGYNFEAERTKVIIYNMDGSVAKELNAKDIDFRSNDTIRFTAVLEKGVDYAWSEKTEWRPWGEDSEPDKTKYIQRYFDVDNKLIREEYYNMDSCKYNHFVLDNERDATWGRVRVVEYEKDGSVRRDLHWREYPGEAITKEEYEYRLAHYDITPDDKDEEPDWDGYWEYCNKPETDEDCDPETGHDVDCNSDDEGDSGSDDVDSSENDL